MALISAKNIVPDLKRAIVRFPLTCVSLVILCVTVIVLNHLTNDIDGHIQLFIIFYSASVAILSISLKLWSEQVTSRRLSITVQAVAHAMLLLFSIWVGFIAEFDSNYDDLLTASVSVLIILSVWALPFLKRKDDRPQWHFMARTVVNLIISNIIATVFMLSISLLLFCVDSLFSLNMSSSVFTDVYVISLLLIQPLAFLFLMPSVEFIKSGLPTAGKLIRVLANYLLLPITGLYMLTLYAYAAKILINWQLPDGGVCWLVVALIAALLVLIFLVFPFRGQEDQKLSQFILRWLPVAVLPLLVLMSVAIGRRISDYGLTIPRLYLLLFNIWAYVVCIIFFITRTKRFSWVITSFALGFFITSIGPWSVSNITLHSISSNLTQTLNAAGYSKLPLTLDQFSQFLSKLKPEQKQSVISQLSYLRYTFTEKDAAVFVIDPSEAIYQHDDSEAKSPYYVWQNRMLTGRSYSIPQNGLKHFAIIDVDSVSYSHTATTIQFTIPSGSTSYNFIVPTSKVNELKNGMYDSAAKPELVIKSSQGPIFYVDFINADQQHISLRGILFY